MNKIQKEIKHRKHVEELHVKYVEEFCRKCGYQGCYSEDLKNGTLTISEVVEDRIKKYTCRQTDNEIQEDYNCQKLSNDAENHLKAN